MKKSVVIPFERYQELTQQQRATTSPFASAAPATTTTAATAAAADAVASTAANPIETKQAKAPHPRRSAFDDDDDEKRRHLSIRTVAALPASAANNSKLHPDVILCCLPAKNRLKAKRLLEHIERHPNLDWNQAGNLLVQGKPIEFSHIVDLLRDALNSTKHEPVGHQDFYANLQSLPQSLVNKHKRKLASERLPPPGLPAKQPKPVNTWRAKWRQL